MYVVCQIQELHKKLTTSKTHQLLCGLLCYSLSESPVLFKEKKNQLPSLMLMLGTSKCFDNAASGYH